MINNEELPIGFTMALAQHSDALNHFSKLSEAEQQKIIEEAKQKHSRESMRNYVENMFQG
ncbi:MAG: hypothetical protein QM793_09940 [Muricomes sp.]